MIEHEATERRLSREDLLKLTAAAGGAALLGTRVGQAGAALSRLGAESGNLRILDWAGYGYDGGQAMFAAYAKKYPKSKPKFTVWRTRQTRSRSCGRDEAGHLPPVCRLGEVLRGERLVQPWNPKLLPNLKHLNPTMVKAGQYKGKQ